MRVIIADDAAVVREGLARLLADRGVEVVATCRTAEQLLQQVDADPPDVAVIDIRMPPTFTREGLLAANRIRADHPEVGTLVLSQYVEVDYALALLSARSGHVGYLLKERVADVEDFLADLRRVAAGETVIEPQLVDELIGAPATRDPLARLTSREREVLGLLAEGKTDRGVSEALFVSRKTVEAHARSIFLKLGLPEDARENRRVHAVLAYLAAPRPQA